MVGIAPAGWYNATSCSIPAPIGLWRRSIRKGAMIASERVCAATISPARSCNGPRHVEVVRAARIAASDFRHDRFVVIWNLSADATEVFTSPT